MDDQPDIEFILAYVPDWTGLRLFDAAMLAIEMDYQAANDLENDFLLEEE